MSQRSEAVKKWRKNAKARLIRGFGGSCCICGYNKTNEALEFHHLDPTTKETTWGAINGSIKGWNTIVQEMKKCVMLCSNCHKEVHAGFNYVPENAPRLDESIADYKEEEKKQYYDNCPHCGQEKKKIYKTCGNESCRLKSRVRIVDWSKHDVIQLVDEYKNYTLIGEMLGVSGAAVARQYRKALK